MVLFPAGKGITPLQIRQQMSVRNLNQFARLLSMIDVGNVSATNEYFKSEMEANFDKWSRSFQIPYDPKVLDVFRAANFKADLVSDYIKQEKPASCLISIHSKNKHQSLTIKPLASEVFDMSCVTKITSKIVVHERLGLWPDDTVAVRFSGLGAVRMKASDFIALANGTAIKITYHYKLRYWSSE